MRERRRGRGGGRKGEDCIGLFSSTCSDQGLKGRQVKPYTSQWSSCCDTRGVVPLPGSREIRDNCRLCGFGTLPAFLRIIPNGCPLLDKPLVLTVRNGEGWKFIFSNRSKQILWRSSYLACNMINRVGKKVFYKLLPLFIQGFRGQKCFLLKSTSSGPKMQVSVLFCVSVYPTNWWVNVATIIVVFKKRKKPTNLLTVWHIWWFMDVSFWSELIWSHLVVASCHQAT